MFLLIVKRNSFSTSRIPIITPSIGLLASTRFDNDLLFLSSIVGVIGTGHYCEERRFPADVRDLAKALVPITRRLWQLTKVGNLSQ